MNCIDDGKRINVPDRALCRRKPVIELGNYTHAANRKTLGTSWFAGLQEKKLLAGVAQGEFHERLGQLTMGSAF